MIEHIPELDRAGIDSFKIEGRAKSEYYTAIVTNAYRNALDEYLIGGRKEDFTPSKWILDEMEKMSHREYTEGFNFGPIKKGQVTDSGGYIRSWDVCALFRSYENGRLTVSQRNRFFSGDKLEVVEPGKIPYTITVEELYNVDDGEFCEAANKATNTYSFKCDKEISPDAIFRVQRK
jgi:putative protease